ncbi:MAG TPA: glycosyltransferase family 4 protein [Saprospiraceae bacterium]|nr:glycosyltransferase family 4 protein [Saprospiraceae bacterium]HMP12438.1 glycosyltransferase family 4 protein [Saprospiraceae bacterium]
MKILQLCKKFPYPLKDGESIAVKSLSKSLRELDCEVTLLAMNTHKHFFNLEHLPVHFDHYTAIHTVMVDNRIKPFDAICNLFSSRSYHVIRFESDAFRNKLIQLLQENEYDIIQLETLYLAPYIPIIRRYSNAIVVMRAHNVEHEIWQRVTDNTRFLHKKWYLKYLTHKLRQYEIAQLQHYDALLAITARDLTRFKALGYPHPAMVAPIGISGGDYKPAWQQQAPVRSLAFIGSLDWMPNQEGLLWFLEAIWPHLLTRFPDLTFHIAGRNTPESILRLQVPNVIVHGEVPDAAEFINNHSMMVVPLRSGSGMRVKILEGMALGKAVLTTRIGLEGIDARHRREVLIADDAKSFVNAVSFCYNDATFAHRIGQQARAFILKRYDNREIALQLLRFYANLLGKPIEQPTQQPAALLH